MTCPEPDEILGFLRGSLADDARARVEAHVAGCDDCRRAVAVLETASATERLPATPKVPHEGALPGGTQIGRYLILGTIGAGGMGIVYEAYDPELDRRIALKLLRAADGVGDQQRLQREAQALARLSHPNVVAVHDVGVHDGRVFVAMELVDGSSVKRWLRETRRGWRQVLAVFLEAGRGLAAAHAVGLVHRDVKPDNILLGKDGRVRVTDFGLARRGGAPRDDSSELDLEVDVESTGLTRSGAMIGTPAYMAPEQYRRQPIDARSDQFSFCVALFEGLHGVRPFRGTTLKELTAAVTGGAITEAPRGAVPAWLERRVRRGLSPDPRDRYPSMAALLADLARDPRAQVARGVAAAIAGIGLVGGAAALYLRPVDAAGGPRCDGAEARLDGIWDPARRRELAAAFASAADAHRAVEAQLDRYTGDWVAMREEACLATARGEQSTELLDLRMRCLDRRLDEVAALVDVLAAGDRAAIAGAIDASRALGALHRCGQAQLLEAVVPPPDPADQEQVAALDAELARARVLVAAGKLDDARALLDRIRGEVDRLAYPPVLARFHAAIARIQTVDGDLPAAEESLQTAIAAAEQGRDDLTRAALITQLADLVGHRRSDHARGLALVDQAAAVIERLGGDTLLEARLATTHGAILSLAARYDEALVVLERARALWKRVPDAAPIDVAVPPSTIALTYQQLGRFDEALAENQAAEAIVTAAYGDAHPESARLAMNRGLIHVGLAHPEEATAAYRSALAINTAIYGADSWQAALVHLNLGFVAGDRGDYLSALAEHRRALAIFEEVYGHDHLWTARPMLGIAIVLLQQGAIEEAIDTLEVEVAIKRRAQKDHPDTGISLALWAYGEVERGDPARAFELLAEAAPMVARDARPLVSALADAVTGEAHLARGDTEAAIAPLERAIAAYDREPAAAWDGGTARFALARALSARPEERRRARALADQARAIYRRLGDRHPRDVAKLEAWLGR